MKESPLVSVVIPNYNHARYLPQRIESVLHQSYQNIELILLDDCSTDNSRRVLTHYASLDETIQTVFNATNSGSPFAQWNKGVSLARGEFVWIAESDDFADRHFLERLVPLLINHPNIGLAYCQSYNVNEDGQILSSRLDWTSNLDQYRWQRNFINSGVAELQHYFLFKNTIPNASAVLMRKKVFLDAGGACASMRLNGDKMTWTRMLLVADIAYCAEHLNYFRTHQQNVRSVATYRNKLENFEWASFLSQRVSIPRIYRRPFAKLLMSEWKQTLFNKRYPTFIQDYRTFLAHGRKISKQLHQSMWLYFLISLPLIGLKVCYYSFRNKEARHG